ncbi:ABC transporter permease [Marispirochaeta aestuarii]|uniref:ABC transporter permease n=1 Tax=Marispirochaeta aestuarii TaxID=1963862 RepID=UPI0029C7FA1B|nr:ABC transporter permease [Marispirochaeta aestuarii]
MGLYGIILKEFKHIVRDYRTLMILFILPVLMLVLFGYAMTLEIPNIRLAVEDLDNSAASRELIAGFRGSEFFTLPEAGGLSGRELFRRRVADALLTIPGDYGRGGAVDLQIDASDSNRALIVRQYISAVVERASDARTRRPPIVAVPAFLYNRQLDSAFFFVPALTALIIIMVTALLTSLTITREKEQGTFDLIKLSPVHAYEVIIGKVVPYLLLSLVIGTLIVLCGVLMFGVPMRGSIPAMLFYLILYCLTGLSFGILISTVAASQQTAMLLSLIGTLLPTLFLSGFIFPLESMPSLLRAISWIVPARYFLIIIRGLMLKGNTQRELIFPILMLSAFSAFFLLVAIRRFKAYLEG